MANSLLLNNLSELPKSIIDATIRLELLTDISKEDLRLWEGFHSKLDWVHNRLDKWYAEVTFTDFASNFICVEVFEGEFKIKRSVFFKSLLKSKKSYIVKRLREAVDKELDYHRLCQ